MIFLRLFYEFFKTGLFSIGGGMATLPFLYDMGEKTGWFTVSDVTNMLAVSESTPGPIGVNMATYVGYEVAGVLGAVIATLGLVAPSIIVILIIAKFLAAFRQNKYVDAAFWTIRPASCALVAAAGISVVTVAIINIDLYKTTRLLSDLINPKALILAAVIIILTRAPKVKKLHPIIFIALSAAVGIIFKF